LSDNSFDDKSSHTLSDNILKQQKIEKYKLVQCASTEKAKILRFEEKIPAIQARSLDLMTFFQTFDNKSSLRLSNNILKEKIR
jgi:hypothetical protein